MARQWKELAVVVRVKVPQDCDINEGDLRYRVESLVGGDELHIAFNRYRPIDKTIPTGKVTVIRNGRRKR